MNIAFPFEIYYDRDSYIWLLIVAIYFGFVNVPEWRSDMKRIWSLVLVIIMCFCCGCGNSSNKQTQTPSTSPNPVVSATALPATPESFQKMNCVYDSVVRAMLQCQFEQYDPTNTTCLWNAIYFLANSVGDTLKGGKVIYNEDMTQLIVPTEVMKEYAAACYSQFNELPEIPADMKMIVYNEQNDEYDVACSDNGDIYYTYASGQQNDDKTYSVVVQTYEGDKPTKVKYDVTLVDNPTTVGLSDSNYPYSVVAAKEK